MPRKKKVTEPELVQLQFEPEPEEPEQIQPEPDPDQAGMYYNSDKIRELDALYNVVIGTRSNGKTFDWCSDILEEYFIRFLSDPSGDLSKKEFLVPVLIDHLIKEKKASVRILPTDEKWIGITYREDTQAAREEFAKMAKEGIYPEKLWP